MKFRNWLFTFIVLVIAAIASRDLFKPGYFPMHDDIQVMRLNEMEKCIRDGQFPCRWVPDMGAEYGHPLFNYHQPFPYYLGMLFRAFGMPYVDIVKLLFALTFFLSGIFMYFLVKEIWGEKAGLISSIIFIFVPYRAVDVYVRGALTEIWGITFFPLIFLAFYKYVKKENFFWFSISILSLSGLFLSHNILTLLFVTFVIVWIGFWIYFFRKFKLIPRVIILFLWSISLSAFFVIPAFFERSQVTMQTLTTGYYDFQNHYATFKQLLFDRSFGYGPSRTGPVDDMSFQLGWPHWILSVSTGLIAVFFFFKKYFSGKRKIDNGFKLGLLSVFLFIFWLISCFMTHSRSYFIWKFFPVIEFVQFPWRFLALSMFFGSLLAGCLIFIIKNKWVAISVIVVIPILVVTLNLGYFKPLKMIKIDDKGMLSGEQWKRQSMTTLLDYYPVSVKVLPTDLAFKSPEFIVGSGEIGDFLKLSNRWEFSADIKNGPAKIIIPVFDFPNWNILADKKEIDYLADDKLGLIIVNLPKGAHKVEGNFIDTPLRNACNKISLLSLIALTGYGLFNIYKKKNYENN